MSRRALLIILFALIQIFTNEAIASEFSGIPFASNFQGKITYDGSYSGQAARNVRSRPVALNGRFNIELEIHGQNIKGTLAITSILSKTHISGTLVDGVCSIDVPGQQLPIVGNCGSEGYEGTIDIVGTKTGQIAVKARSKNFIPFLAPESNGPRAATPINGETLVPGIQGLKIGDPVIKITQLVNGVSWQKYPSQLYYDGAKPEASLWNGAYATETRLYFDGPNELLTRVASDYLFMQQSDRDALAKSLTSQYRSIYSNREGEVYCSKDDSRYIILQRNQYISSKPAQQRLQVLIGADCRTYDTIATDKRVPENIRKLRHASPTTQQIRAACLIRDKHSLKMEYKPTVRVEVETGRIVGRGNDDLTFGIEDTAGNLCLIPITLRCSEPKLRTVVNNGEWINCTGKIDVE